MEELRLEDFIEEGFLIMQKPPCLFRQKGAIKVSQIMKAHTTYHFGLSQFTPTDPMNLPTISPLPLPKFLYYCLNIITKPEG